MRSFVGAVIALVVVAALGLGAIAVLRHAGEQLPSISAVTPSSPVPQYAGTKQATLSLETFPMNPYEDPDFISANVTGKTLDGEPYPTAPGDNQDWVTYWPTTALVVPANSLVTIKIYNYDGPTPLLNNYYDTPQGTVDPNSADKNVMFVDGQETSWVDPTNVSHTFTIHSIPNADQPWLYVSVPLTGAAPDCAATPGAQPPDCAHYDDAGIPDAPMVTTFSFLTGAPGTYVWQCFDPCGAGFNGFGGPMGTKGYMSGTITVQ
jgi:hypothetical protein